MNNQFNKRQKRVKKKIYSNNNYIVKRVKKMNYMNNHNNKLTLKRV